MQYRITLTFLEPMLGTAPLDKQVYSSYIAEQTSKANGDEEIDIGKATFGQAP